MKSVPKIISISLVMVLLAAGGWTLFTPVGPGAETAAHQRAVYSAAYNQLSGEPQVQTSHPDPVEPVMLTIPETSQKSEDSQYNRWLRGEIDMDETEFRVPPAEVAALREAAMNMAPGDAIQADPAGDLDAPSSGSPTILNSFDSLDYNDSGGYVPPDTDLAVGMNHIIAVVNSEFQIYDKTGSATSGVITFDTFLGASGTFDPTVLYDSEEDRWVMGIEDGEFFWLMISDDGNPNGSWWYYKFDAQFYGDEFFDYPHIGIGDAGIFMGANMFGGSVPGGYEGRVYYFNKTQAYAMGSVTWYHFSVGGNGGTPQPLNLTGFPQGTVPSFSSHYFLTDRYDGSTADLWKWNSPYSSAPTVVQTYNLNSLMGWTAGYPLQVPQNGSGSQLDIEANDWRFRSFEYRNGSAWFSDTVSYDMGSGTVDIVRWGEIDLSTAGYPFVQGNGFGTSGSNYIFPDLAVDHCNNMALGFGASNASIWPGARYTGRLSTDPSGNLQGSTLLVAGQKTYSAWDGEPLRWGDYSGMVIDPDGKTFWMMGEYSKNITGAANWGNYIAKLTYDCNVGGSTPPADFDGDGDTDVSVYRPSNGNWYIMGVGYQSWGLPGDRPVPADYDGDGAVDIAVYRPTNQKWYLMGIGNYVWGASGDVPMPCDYDGDGADDIAVYRPSNGNWYIFGQGYQSWGLPGDIPVPGDYDGDGACEAAVYRPSNQKWYVSGVGTYKWGVGGDIPVPGDYDGDGQIDMAVYRPSNGNWYVYGQGYQSWGVYITDVPVPGDYNGDGIYEVAILRPSNGKWYIKGVGTYNWFQVGDFPLPVRDTNNDGDPHH